jgi:hypothetical protein
VAHVSQHGDQDFLVYPIVFNFRHYLELALKHLIIKTRQLADIPPEFDSRHDLRDLWKECRPLIEQAWADEPWDSKQLDTIGTKIDVLGAVDERSFAFRYPKDSGGASYIPADLIRFNLRYFAEQVNDLAERLDSIIEATVVHLEIKDEMEGDFRQEMETDLRSEMRGDCE